MGCVISALLFEHDGSRYSPLGCFISELGDVEHARGHAAFNGALMLALNASGSNTPTPPPPAVAGA